MTPEQPTATQQCVLDFLIAYRAEHGHSPSIRELMTALGFRSPSAIQHHLRALRDLGLVAWHPYRSRSLTPLHPSSVSHDSHPMA